MDNPGLTWKEAEELYPECSAAWDRDVGDLYHPVLLIKDELMAYDPQCMGVRARYVGTDRKCMCHFFDRETKRWIY